MSNQLYLPPEPLDDIADFLHNSRNTLNNCCLVPNRAFHVLKSTFLQMSNSSTCTTLNHGNPLFSAPPPPLRVTPKPCSLGGPGQLRPLMQKRSIESNRFSCCTSGDAPQRCDPGESASRLPPSHGFSSAVKSLHLTYLSPPLAPILDLIHSFPLLEDLCVLSPIHRYIVY